MKNLTDMGPNRRSSHEIRQIRHLSSQLRDAFGCVVALTNAIHQIHQVERRAVESKPPAGTKREIDGLAGVRQVIQLFKSGVRIGGHQTCPGQMTEQTRQEKHTDKPNGWSIPELFSDKPGNIKDDPTPRS